MFPRRDDDNPVRSGVHIELDPEVAAGLKAERDRRLHAEQIPLVRALGFAFLAVSLAVYDWLILGISSWPGVVRFAVAVAVYSLVSSWVLRKTRDIRLTVRLGESFLVADLAFFAAAVYLSGGETSGIFFILLARAADQVGGGPRRTFVFGQLAVLAYLGMLGWIAWVDGRPLSVSDALVRGIFLLLGAIYLTMCALPSERRRRAVSAAVRTARDLIGRLRTTLDALEESRIRAEEASEAKSQFLATMSHELRTPLTVVIGMSDLLADTDLDERQQRYVAQVRQGARATLELVGDVLELANLDRGRYNLEQIPYSPRAILADLEREMAPAAAAKDLRLEATLGEHLEIRPEGDPRRIRQLLQVLTDNAIKFTDEGSVEIRCDRSMMPDRRPSLRWTVSDTGLGFDATRLDELMQDFVQGDQSSTRRHGGAGIGLALARRLVAAMHGVLEVDSVPGAGTTFRVELPLAAGAEPSESRTSSQG